MEGAVLTVAVRVFDVAGFPVGQVALEVRMQYTWSPLVGATRVYVAPAPAELPFRYQA